MTGCGSRFDSRQPIIGGWDRPVGREQEIIRDIPCREIVPQRISYSLTPDFSRPLILKEKLVEIGWDFDQKVLT